MFINNLFLGQVTQRYDFVISQSCTVIWRLSFFLISKLGLIFVSIYLIFDPKSGAPSDKFVKGLSTIGVQQIDRVVEVVDETLKGNTVKILAPKKIGGSRAGGAALSLPKIRRNPLIEIISVNTGCLNACTYCKTKHARGDLASYPIEELVERFKQAFEEGVVEIWLTSEDTGNLLNMPV